MKPVTLKSLAKELNLTEATVSRALNDYSDISANTKQRVNSLAIEKNYFANTTAKRLASGKSETIGYIMPEEYSIDIDTQLDWDIAEFLMTKMV